MTVHVLVRYGRIPEVARVLADSRRERGEKVVVRTHRGLELATILETLRRSPTDEDADADLRVVRDATPADQFEFIGLATRAGTSLLRGSSALRNGSSTCSWSTSNGRSTGRNSSCTS